MNKRGVSEVVSYSLLIVVALTMSVIVYAFLRAYVPKDKPECQDGISIIIENLNCTNNGTANNLSLTLQNTGLFKIDLAFIRIGKEGRNVKIEVPQNNPIPLFGASSGLNPQESTPKLSFNLPYSGVDTYALEVQPATYTKGTDMETIALCSPITQPIKCS